MIRITAGTAKGRILNVPDGNTVRPTTDKVRQAVFNMLEHNTWPPFEAFPDSWLEHCIVLDACAGSGALGLEALSRGAKRAIFWDTDTASLGCIKGNIQASGFQDKAETAKVDATKPTEPSYRRRPVSITPSPLDSGLRRSDEIDFAKDGDSSLSNRATPTLIFLDPPYEKGLEDTILLALKHSGWITQSTLCVVETGKPWQPQSDFQTLKSRQFGRCHVHFVTEDVDRCDRTYYGLLCQPTVSSQ